jgi:hypothetical protein
MIHQDGKNKLITKIKKMSKKIGTPAYDTVWIKLSEIEVDPRKISYWDSAKDEGRVTYDFDQLKSDIKQNGITAPILVTPRKLTRPDKEGNWTRWEETQKYLIKDGNHRIWIAKELYGPDDEIQLTIDRVSNKKDYTISPTKLG